MHHLFISIGNITSHVCMAATSHAWQCMAFMPIPKFEVHPDFQMILQSCVCHKCVDMVTVNLKQAASRGTWMTDPHTDIHHCFMPVAVWTADLPEQLMISCISKNASPITEASHKDLVMLIAIPLTLASSHLCKFTMLPSRLTHGIWTIFRSWQKLSCSTGSICHSGETG